MGMGVMGGGGAGASGSGGRGGIPAGGVAGRGKDKYPAEAVEHLEVEEDWFDDDGSGPGVLR